jgi:polysaccharide export outer membrane protein
MRLIVRSLLVALFAAGAPLCAAAAQADPAVAGPAAVVLPGDQLALRIEREREMSGTFPVDENGDVVLPRLGVVRVAGRSAGSLQDTLRTRYAHYLREPAVAVTVLRRVTVQGEVGRPGVYMADLTTTLRDVLAQAGGISEAGDPRKVDVVRGPRRFRVDAGPYGESATSELRSGDRIVVGRRSWVARNPNVAIGTFTGLVTFFIGIVNLLKD